VKSFCRTPREGKLKVVGETDAIPPLVVDPAAVIADTHMSEGFQDTCARTFRDMDKYRPVLVLPWTDWNPDESPFDEPTVILNIAECGHESGTRIQVASAIGGGNGPMVV
jgi:hypothetical protein